MPLVLVFLAILTACPVQQSSAQDVLDDETVLMQMPTLQQHQNWLSPLHARGTHAKHQSQKMPSTHAKHGSHRKLAKHRTKHTLQRGLKSMPAPHDIKPETKGMPSLLGINRARMLQKIRSKQDPDDEEEPSWPTPDDPNVEITEKDREHMKTFKEGVRTKNVSMINNSVAMLALAPVRFDVEEGVHEMMFQVIKDYQDDEYQYLQQYAWRGLSDQSVTVEGSHIIANVGGKNKGIEYMVDQLLAHPFYYGYCADHLTVQYEILMCMNGLLLLDTNGTRGEAAVKRGLVPGIMRTLMGESELLASQSTACKVMASLFMRHPEYVPYFNKAGAYPLLVDAMDRFADGDDTPFLFGYTMGEMYNISSCYYAASLMYLEQLKDSMIANYEEWKPWLKIEGV